MYKFSEVSLERKSTLDTKLQFILDQAIKYIDFSIICGYRSELDQDYAYASGKSQLKYPQSKHNTNPSRAVDIAPYPIKWSGEDARERFHYLAGIIMGIAFSRGIEIRWGGDWNKDGEILDNGFDDLVHFELMD